MSFVKHNHRASLDRASAPPSRRARPLHAFSSTGLLRVVLLASFGIAGASWALVRHIRRPDSPLLVPGPPRPAPTYDSEAGELPVPDFADPDGG